MRLNSSMVPLLHSPETLMNQTVSHFKCEALLSKIPEHVWEEIGQLNLEVTDSIELGQICQRIDAIIAKYIEPEVDANNPQWVRLLKEIARTRKKIHARIIHDQKKCGNWEKTSWKKGRDHTVQTVKNTITAYLGIPRETPVKHSEEWNTIRLKLLKVSQPNFTEWRLQSAFNENPDFSSYIDVLIAAFDGEYEIADEMQTKRNKRKLHWRSEKETVLNVKRIVIEKLQLPQITPLKHSKEWQVVREKLVNIASRNMAAWGLASSYNNCQWFNSYIDVLVAAFDTDYEIRTVLESKHFKAEYSWKTKYETLANVRTAITLKLELPLSPPQKDSEEWQRSRKKIMNITVADMRRWKLFASFGENKFFRSVGEVIIAAFGRQYDIQEFEKKWEGVYTWKSREETMNNVRTKVVDEHVLSFPTKGSERWKSERQAIIRISAADMKEWGLKGAFNENEWFYSYIDLLIVIFDGAYDIREEMIVKKCKQNFGWKSPRECAVNVKKTVCDQLGFSIAAPQKGGKKWHENREKILNIKKNDMAKWSLAAANNTEWFSSYIDVLVATFREYEIAPWMFKTFGQFVFRLTYVPTQQSDTADCVMQRNMASRDKAKRNNGLKTLKTKCRQILSEANVNGKSAEVIIRYAASLAQNLPKNFELSIHDIVTLTQKLYNLLSKICFVAGIDVPDAKRIRLEQEKENLLAIVFSLPTKKIKLVNEIHALQTTCLPGKRYILQGELASTIESATLRIMPLTVTSS